MSRIGDWGCTASGKRYWPADPRPEDIDINDIAHALSMQCRFGGHVKEFYSVAQHSVHVSEHCSPADALWGLLHDASEAYIVDIPRPLKYAAGMEGYLALERKMMHAVCDAFGLPREMPASVRAADELLLASEACLLMPDTGDAAVQHWGIERLDAPACAIPWTPEHARQRFLARFHELTEGVR